MKNPVNRQSSFKSKPSLALKAAWRSLYWKVRPRNKNGSNQRCHFVCFASFGSPIRPWLEAQQFLLCLRMQALGVFDKITAYQHDHLPDDYKRQREKRDRKRDRKRSIFKDSFLWKPFVLNQALQDMHDGDLLLYMDCNWHIAEGKEGGGLGSLYNCLFLVQQSDCGILIFPEDRSLQLWTRKDALAYSGLEEKYFDVPQVVSSSIFVRKCAQASSIIDEWCETSRKRPDLFEDEPGFLPPPPNYVKHKHDQAILSCILTKKGCHPLAINGELPLIKTSVEEQRASSIRVYVGGLGLAIRVKRSTLSDYKKFSDKLFGLPNKIFGFLTKLFWSP